jgi:hypothetical protein
MLTQRAQQHVESVGHRLAVTQHQDEIRAPHAAICRFQARGPDQRSGLTPRRSWGTDGETNSQVVASVRAHSYWRE